MRRIVTLASPAPDVLKAELDSIYGRNRVKLCIAGQSEAAFMPMVTGILKPIIILPATLVGSKTTEQLEPILAHELIHIRRKDGVIGWLQIVTQIFWWFHPVVWLANREVNRRREECCRRRVKRHRTGIQCRLIKMSANYGNHADFCPVFAFVRAYLRDKIHHLFIDRM